MARFGKGTTTWVLRAFRSCRNDRMDSNRSIPPSHLLQKLLKLPIHTLTNTLQRVVQWQPERRCPSIEHQVVARVLHHLAADVLDHADFTTAQLRFPATHRAIA